MNKGQIKHQLVALAAHQERLELERACTSALILEYTCRSSPADELLVQKELLKKLDKEWSDVIRRKNKLEKQV